MPNPFTKEVWFNSDEEYAAFHLILMQYRNLEKTNEPEMSNMRMADCVSGMAEIMRNTAMQAQGGKANHSDVQHEAAIVGAQAMRMLANYKEVKT
ncbi:MAG: hypothetical protein K1X81_02035 [Bacteroidia bacterium]|nr:hypothetical protein [Bacteroidia bacterium]